MNGADTRATSNLGASPSRAPQALAFSSFRFLYAAAILLHQLHESGFSRPDGFDAILNLAALASLLRPESVPRFLTLCAAQIVACSSDMPFVWNHWMFLALASVSILVGGAHVALRGRGRVPAVELFAATAPILRLELVLVYAFAALAKLNSAYFDPQRSCAVVVYEHLTASLPFLPSGAGWAWGAIWGSVIIELILPLLLLVPRTRVAGLLTGAAFHVLLGIHENYDFSAVLIPFYCLFVPEEVWAALPGLRGRFPRLSALQRRGMELAASPYAFAAVAAVAVALMQARHLPGVGEHRLHAHLSRAGLIGWLALCGFLCFALLAALGQGRRRLPASSPRLPYRSPLVAPLLIVITGLAPYLGLHTERAFAMFSNLRTEGEHWNHYFMPRGLRVFAFQDRLYEIVRSTDADLQQAADRKVALVPFEVRRRLSANPEAAVTYRLDGERHDVTRAGDHPEVSGPLNPLLAWLFWFRPVAPRGACSH